MASLLTGDPKEEEVVPSTLEPNYYEDIAIDDGSSSRDDDLDSTLGSESSSQYSASVTSSIYNYRYENGRRYHAYRDGRYLLPNDEAEQDRLDYHHHLWRLILDGPLYRAPLGRNLQRVLDLGTGTGIWAIDFADEFPGALVIGTDLSPIQPSNVPPNLKFYVDDIESEWTYGPEEKFDYIHGRALGGSIANYDQLYRVIYENLKPGGWVEMQEYDTAIYSVDDPELVKSPKIKYLADLINEASVKAGAKFMIAKDQKQKMMDAGLEDVRDDVYKIPVGLWPKGRKMKELGVVQREHVKLGFDSFTPGLLGRVLGWSEEEYSILIAEAKRELYDPKLHMYIKFRFIYGRKPMGH